MDIGGKLINHFFHGEMHLILGVHGRADCRKEVGIVGIDDMLIIQL